MRKLILYPALLFCFPQVGLLAGYALIRLIAGQTETLTNAYAIGAAGAVLFSTITGLFGLFGAPMEDGWLKEYEDQQKALARQREIERRKLEEELGIPRIPSSR